MEAVDPTDGGGVVVVLHTVVPVGTGSGDEEGLHVEQELVHEHQHEDVKDDEIWCCF